MWKCENVANNQYQLPIGTGNWSWQHFHIGNIAAKPLLALAVCILACFNAALAQDVFRAETQRRGDFTPYSLRLSDSARGYWIDENISTAGDTGEWSRDVLYERATGRAVMDGEYVFTPNEPSAGKYVTVKVAATFPVVKGNAGPGADAQAAVKMGANGFQVWVGKCCQCENVANTNTNYQLELGIGTGNTGNIGNIKQWLDVAAHGVTPVAGREYELEFVFDYAARRYSVAVKDDAGAWRRLSDARGRQAFALAAKAERISSITLDGKARFRSLKGSHTDAVLSRAETRRRGADADPIGNAAVLASTSQTCLEFRRGQSNSPQTCLEFRRTKSNSPQACPEFRRTKSNCPQGPPEFGWTQSNSPQAPSESGWAQSKETSLKNTI